MVELEQALERLVGTATFALKGGSSPLLESMGKICEQDIFSPMAQPPFPMAKADGYALRIEDIRGADENHPVILKLVETVYAGMPTESVLGVGEAMRITEGAVIPSGADCVINAVHTDCSNELEVSVYTSGFYQQNITLMGEEVAKGQYLVRKGERITASQIGLLAGSGMLTVPVYQPLRVGILTTGAEITEPHYPLEKGHIYDANTMMLRARIESLGMTAVLAHQQVGDDVAKTCATIEEMMPDIDVLFTTGGVSLGKQDLIEQVYGTLPITSLFEGIYFWPGMQTYAGVYGRKMILSFSGSPSACLLTFDLLGRALCAKLSGERESGVRSVVASFSGEMTSSEPVELRRFYFGTYNLSENTVMIPRGSIRPGGLLRASESNCFLEIPKGVRSLKNGDGVRVILL